MRKGLRRPTPRRRGQQWPRAGPRRVRRRWSASTPWWRRATPLPGSYPRMCASSAWPGTGITPRISTGRSTGSLGQPSARPLAPLKGKASTCVLLAPRLPEVTSYARSRTKATTRATRGSFVASSDGRPTTSSSQRTLRAPPLGKRSSRGLGCLASSIAAAWASPRHAERDPWPASLPQPSSHLPPCRWQPHPEPAPLWQRLRSHRPPCLKLSPRPDGIRSSPTGTTHRGQTFWYSSICRPGGDMPVA
mmetsp:Transcript_10388/g.23366  ORF Transcript_10388/g.23366 Transcript_10388/m.23366 type:complete len:248 (-) Transcript_10388:1114-1857(-)